MNTNDILMIVSYGIIALMALITTVRTKDRIIMAVMHFIILVIVIVLILHFLPS